MRIFWLTDLEIW